MSTTLSQVQVPSTPKEEGTYIDAYGNVRKYRIGQVVLLRDGKTDEVSSIVKLTRNLWFGGYKNFYQVAFIRRGEEAKDSEIVDEDDLVKLEDIEEPKAKKPEGSPYRFPVHI